jgi:hypothetical protein
VKENKEKVKLNNQLPYLVGNVVEVLDINPDDEEEEDGAAVDLDSQRQGICNMPVPNCTNFLRVETAKCRSYTASAGTQFIGGGWEESLLNALSA